MEREQSCALSILESHYLFPSFKLHKGESNTQNLCVSTTTTTKNKNIKKVLLGKSFPSG